eukprot:953200-Amphidinium_carterae.1
MEGTRRIGFRASPTKSPEFWVVTNLSEYEAMVLDWCGPLQTQAARLKAQGAVLCALLSKSCY